jgi:hypothetical protein
MKDVVIVLLTAVLIFFIGSEARYTKSEPVIVTDTVYQQKTFTKFIKGKSIPFVILDTIYNIDTTRYYKTDTIYIVKDYNQVKVYSDTMRIDSLGYAYIQDTISQNKIQGRGFSANFNLPTITITKILETKSKNQLYLGFIGDLKHSNGQIGIGGSIALKTAKNTLYTATATMNGYSFGYYKKF